MNLKRHFNKWAHKKSLTSYRYILIPLLLILITSLTLRVVFYSYIFIFNARSPFALNVSQFSSFASIIYKFMLYMMPFVFVIAGYLSAAILEERKPRSLLFLTLVWTYSVLVLNLLLILLIYLVGVFVNDLSFLENRLYGGVFLTTLVIVANFFFTSFFYNLATQLGGLLYSLVTWIKKNLS